jgi:hypothetical protein
MSLLFFQAVPVTTNAAKFAANVVLQPGIGQQMIRNVAGQRVGAQLLNTDGTPFTGAATVYIVKDGGAQAIGSVGGGVATHKGNGYHQYAPSQAETDADLLAYTFIGVGAIAQTVHVYTLPDTEIADAVLKRDWAQVTGEASRSVLNALRHIRNRWYMSGLNLVVTKEDDATQAWSAAVGTNAAADPITSVDPT